MRQTTASNQAELQKRAMQIKEEELAVKQKEQAMTLMNNLPEGEEKNRMRTELVKAMMRNIMAPPQGANASPPVIDLGDSDDEEQT